MVRPASRGECNSLLIIPGRYDVNLMAISSFNFFYDIIGVVFCLRAVGVMTCVAFGVDADGAEDHST